MTGLKESNNYYLKLVIEFPPRPIKNDEELIATQNRVYFILDKPILQSEDRENENSLDALFGMQTRESLRYIVLFINKLDKWENSGQSNAEQEAKEAYTRLIERLQNRVYYIDRESGRKIQYAEFKVMVGSSINPPPELVRDLCFYAKNKNSIGNG